MATIVRNMRDYESKEGARFVFRESIPAGDTLVLIGMPGNPWREQRHGLAVRVFPTGTVNVFGSSGSEADIEAGVANKIAWPDGPVTADTEGWLRGGFVGLIAEVTGGDCDVEICG